MPIVQATGVAVNSQDERLSARIEDAMRKAVIDCYAKKITDPVEMRNAMLDARDAALKE